MRDVTAMSSGADFMTGIDAALDSCDAVLAVIGPRWMTVAAPDGSPRLDEPDDYVRRELATALRRDVPVVPVLVGGATLPLAAELPTELQPLAGRPAVTLRDDSWREDVAGLVDSLRAETEPHHHLSHAWRILVAVLVVAAVLLIALLVVRKVTDTSASPPGPCPLANQPGATERTLRTDPEASVTSGAGARFTVLDAFVRPADPKEWLVLARVRMTATGTKSADHTFYRYHTIVVGDTTYPLSCFDLVAGEQAVSPGLNSEAEIGFYVKTDPFTSLALELDKGVTLPFADPGV